MNAVDAIDIPFSPAQDECRQVPADCFRERVSSLLFRIASSLTDPVCKGHEFFRRIAIVDTLNQTSSALANLARKIALAAGMVAFFTLGIFTTVPGIAIRAMGAHLQKHPYLIHQAGSGKELSEDRIFSLLSWNLCGPGGGYPITDGGVLPLADRIEKIVGRIVELDADVNCFYEVFDIQAEDFLLEKLKGRGYSHFYSHFGARGVGVPAGLFVASKFRIQNPEFTPFPQEMLIGRTKNFAKGVFRFDLESRGKCFARIFATHLQHSEEPAFPTTEEVEARRKQMQLIVDRIHTVRDRCILVTGDLNSDDDEYGRSSWKSLFQKGDRFTQKTWGGDGFCGRLVGKRASSALNLDHMMAVQGTVKNLSTELIETGFNGNIFNREALSDHLGLLSRIIFTPPSTLP